MAGTAQAFAGRQRAGLAVADAADAIARTCHAMAIRFHRGGKLITFGNGAASADAQHVAVEFLHPVIVGKRALPAICLTNDVATLTGIAGHAGWDEAFADQLWRVAAAGDIALGIAEGAPEANVRRALATAGARGLLTVALVGQGGGEPASDPSSDHALVVHAADPQVVREVQVTIYHLLWELVHVFLEQPGVLSVEGSSCDA